VAAAPSDKGLKKGAIGFVDGLAIGLDSTAPAYSLAAVIGSIVLVMGVQAPGVFLLSFVPMFFIARSFRLSRAAGRPASRLNSLLRVSAYDALAQLPISVEGYELEANDREYSPEFTRGSTIIHLRAGGEEGIGEDVVYDVLDHIAHRDAGPVHDLSGPRTLGELCELLGELDLFPGAPPVRDPSRHYRRWAFESAALDLALRQAGEPLWRVVDREPQPVRFVCSTRLTVFGSEPRRSTTEPVRRRLEKYPTLRFKLDPENDWNEALITELRELAQVDILDLKGLYRGTPVDVETDPELYRSVAAAFPDAYLEDPDINEETRPVLEPHMDRVTWDAPLHSLGDVQGLEHKPPAINSKPSRFGSLKELLSVYEYCEREGIAVYGGGQGELGVGRHQIQYLASIFHPDTPNDVAPSGYNTAGTEPGLPPSPLEPMPTETGFRWGK
jgi:L-alanine-DL-glutamate epimerase-like enolase superfamily enzyme